MPLTEKQAEQIKEQLLKQLDNFPEDKRKQIKEQIVSMNVEQVEEFIKQNQLEHLEGNSCVFCSIAKGETPSIKIYEDEKNVAVLELNPLTKGHTLIIPKEHSEKSDESSRKTAETVSEKIKQILQPIRIQIKESKIMEHSLLEIIPLYSPEFPKNRKKATETELLELQEALLENKKIEVPKQEIQKQPLNSNCLFCALISEKIHSYKLEETKEAIAILEISPLTKGHTLIIPKQHSEVSKIPTSAFSLAKKIAKRIEKKLKAIEIKINSQEVLGHAIVEVLPIYKETDLKTAKREKAREEDLIRLKNLLETKPKKISSQPRPKKKESLGLPILKPRIP